MKSKLTLTKASAKKAFEDAKKGKLPEAKSLKKLLRKIKRIEKKDDAERVNILTGIY